MAFNYPPKGWALCNGQLLPISQNMALFSLLGTQYGGNGSTNFALPDLRGRVPLHTGDGFIQGQPVGAPTETLTIAELPAHPHTAQASSSNAGASLPSNNSMASFLNGYAAPSALTIIQPLTISQVGSGQPHENMAPYLTLNFCIAIQGIYPSRN